MNKRYTKEISIFWELLDNIKKMIPEEVPVEFLEDYTSILEEYTDALTNLFLIEEDNWKIHIERAGQAIGEMSNIIIELSLDSLDEEEKKLSKYTNTGTLLNEFRKIREIKDKALIYMEDNDYFNSSDSFLECLEKIRKLEENITDMKEGSRNIKRDIIIQKWTSYGSFIFGLIGVILVASKFGLLLGVTLLNIVILIHLCKRVKRW